MTKDRRIAEAALAACGARRVSETVSEYALRVARTALQRAKEDA